MKKQHLTEKTTTFLFHEKYAFKYFEKLSEKYAQKENEYHILSQKELDKIHRIRLKAWLLASLYGGAGVVLLYLPSYLFPALFRNYPIRLPWLGLIEFPVMFTIYGILLAVLEIAALIILNVRTVHHIAASCGFPDPEDPHYQDHLSTLFEVSLEKPKKEILTFGINPMEGLSRWSIMFYTVFNLLKASLSNMFVKIVLTRVLGRFAIRAYIDLIGVPIFALWNMYATHRVIRAAQVHIMAPNLIQGLVNKLGMKLKNHQPFREALFDGLQFIAVAKRKFHHNHFLLVENIIQTFEIEYQNRKHLNQEELLETIKKLDEDAKEGLAKLFLFGMLIDGDLSGREQKVLKQLEKEDFIRFDFKQLKKWEKAFIEGKGLDDFFETKLI